ncbi:MAG: response regulator [Chloroflexota bacterium]
MNDSSLKDYKDRVDKIGQSLLDAISSIALGKFDVEIDIPEDVDELADLAVGLNFMIEDLKSLEEKNKEELKSLSHQSNEKEKPLIINDRTAHSGERVETSSLSFPEHRGTFSVGEFNGKEWLPNMTEAVRDSATRYSQNGGDDQSLAIPIRVKDQSFGVIGLNRGKEQPWSKAEITTIESIVEQIGLALENQRLFEQSQQSLSETDLLYKASAEINSTQLYEEVLAVLRRSTLLGEESRYLSINLFNVPWIGNLMPESLNSIARWSDTPQPIIEETAISLNTWTTAEEILSSQSPIIIKNIATDSRMDAATRSLFMGRYDAKMVVFAPLVTAGQYIGTAIATYQKVIDFPSSEIQRLTSLSAQAASSIQNIRLVEETTRRANQLETAAEIAREASATLDVQLLLDRVVNLVRERFGFYHVSIFMIEGDNAIVRASTGEAGKQLVQETHTLPLKEGGSVIGHVSMVGEPLLVNDVSKSATHRPHPLLPNTEAELGIPLKVGTQIIGALDVQSTQANSFSDDDVAVLQTLVDQIAIAVENARSYEVSQQSVEEMREVDRIKSQFLANMSHELRTPLNSIIGFSRVILKGIDGPINDMQKQDLDAIYQSGQHLLEMINSILDLSKIEAGKMELSIDEIEMSELIKGVVSTAMGLVKEKPIMMINNIPDKLPLVKADRTRVRQVILNLLQNATKFTDEGTITLNFEESVNENNMPIAVFSVTDSGIGISEQDQTKLFEPFSQVDDSPTRKTGGSGLGLSISRRLVEMQGGEIWLKSAEGQGSTFYFSLPIASEYVQKPIEEVKVFDDRKVIVSVDDDAKVINLYTRYLDPHGYRVQAITDPKTALEQVKIIKPMAITIDIMMPEKDGWQVIRTLKSDPETKDIPIIICSILDNREKGYELGVSNYLVKPILEDELVEAVNRLDLKSSGAIPRILMIDDDRDAMRLVNKVLSNTDKYHLDFAEGGVKGLAEIQSSPPDAVILDLFMPELDGFSLLESIRTDAALKDLPIIILTGGDVSEDQLAELSDMKQAVLRKDSLDETSLVECLQGFLGN